MSIKQGDQYNIPIKICANNQVVTPDDVDDVRIQVASELREYSKGELTYNDEHWLFPLSEELSRSIMCSGVAVQIAIKNGNDYIYSNTETVPFSYSIIKENWNAED